MPMFIFFRILSLCVENLRFLLVKSLESIVLSQLVSNPGVRVWERGKQESAPAGQPGCSKKGRTPPLDLEGLEFARFGVRQSIYETAGNFCTSDNWKKGWKTQKSGASNLKNQAEAPLRRIQLRFTGWTSTVKTFARFCPQKPENPHEY